MSRAAAVPGAGKLTPGQIRALTYLAGVEYASPAELGYAVEDEAARTKPVRMKPQGAGRLGGTTGTKLVKLGLAEHRSTRFRGMTWPAGYAITPAGRLRLAARGREGGGA